MRILVFDVPASSGGALSILKDFITYIDKNINVHEWYFVVSTENLDVYSPNIYIIRESFPKKSWFHRAFWEIFLANKIVKEIKPDVILSFQNTAIMFTNVPQIVYIHQSIPFCKEKKWSYLSLEEVGFAFRRDLFRLFIGKSVKKAHTVIVQTSWMKDALIDFYHIPDNKINVIPPSVNIPKLEKSLNYVENDSKGKFFYPAFPSLYKNFEVIVEATKKLRDQGYNPKVYLTINGNENRYAMRIRKMLKGIETNFELIGRIPREEAVQFYQNSVLIFPSYLETFGLPLLEARFLNAPIVASDRPFAREILEGYSNADFFDPFSPDDLANKMKKYLEANSSRRSFVNIDKETEVLKKYIPENTWGKIVELIELFGKKYNT
jgi:glycosyltransferase involved in cell wall biosynthesis